MVYVFTSVLLIATSIANISIAKIESANAAKKVKYLNQRLNVNVVKEMDNHNGRGVEEVDFLIAMLVNVNGLDKDKDIEPWRAVLYIYSNI
jgi:hypothetical protein